MADAAVVAGAAAVTAVAGAAAVATGADKDKDTAETETMETETAVAKLGDNVHISNHPVLSHKISVMRSSSTLPAGFRASLREITFHLGYEATSTLTTRPIDISVPTDGDDGHHIDAKGQKLKEKIALVPILRSGLGMVEPMLELIPSAAVHHIGMYKRKAEGSMPVMYYNRLPKKCAVDVAYVLDPIVGTAATTMSVIGILKKWGVQRIHLVCVVASQKGMEQLTEHHPDVCINVGEVDTQVSPEGLTLPGMGDSGDRLYGTAITGTEEEDDESLLHISKRKKSDA